MSNPPANRSPIPRLRRTLCALFLGGLAGVCAHYLIYRLSLPAAPFIYVAF